MKGDKTPGNITQRKSIAAYIEPRMVREVKSLHSWDSLALMGSRGRIGRAGNPFLRGKDLKLKVTHPLAKSYALSNAIDA